MVLGTESVDKVGRLQAALALAAMGWGVIPCHSVEDGKCSCGKADCGSPGKHPRTAHGSTDGTTDAEQIRRWWAQWPTANVAVCTGPESGLFMVGPDGAAGIEALAELERQHGPLPRTVTAKSGGGGKHLYFCYPAEGTIPNRRNHQELPIDVRGAGGYALAPPSRNKDGPYTWEPGLSPHETEVAEAPDWLVTFCREDGRPKRSSPPPVCRLPKHTGGASAEARAIAYLDTMAPAISSQGGHNATMAAARAVCWGFDLGAELGYEILATYYNPRCVPPWSEKELRHKADEADTKPFDKPRSWLLNADRPRNSNGRTYHAGNGAARPTGEDVAHGDAFEPPPDEPGGEQPAGDPEPPPRTGWTFSPMDSAAFAALDCRPGWLVKEMLVADQPGIIGGPRKTLKTTIEVDLCLSLGTGKPFLGFWEVPRPLRTVLLSGESGEWAIQETARRVCAAKGVQLKDADVLWGMTLPQLSNPADMAELRDGLERHQVKVAIIDPLYLCMLAGQPDLQASNLFDVGPLLLAAARACLSAGCTPILVHHARKNLTHPFEAMELEDLAFAGVQEFARQWLLLSRREPYEPGSGSHRLWLTVGGAVGFGGCWAVDVEEGALRDDFSGRRWEVSVAGAADARAQTAEQGDQRKQEQQARQDKADDALVLETIDYFMRPKEAPKPQGKKRGRKKAIAPDPPAPQPPTRRAVHVQSRLSAPRVSRAVNRLLDARLIEEVDVVLMVGKGHKTARTEKGLRRPEKFIQEDLPADHCTTVSDSS
jgi:hypothetical protein